MIRLRLQGHLRGALVFGLALPLCVGAALLSPRAVSSADACTGGNPGFSGTNPGWWALYPNEDPAMPSDGVVVVAGSLKGLSEAEAVASAEVSVTADASGGTNVPGDFSLLDHLRIPVGGVTSRDAALVFRPSAPLAPGTYRVHVGKYLTKQLTVTAAAASGPALPALSSSFVTVPELSGAVLSCPSDGNCGQKLSLQLPAGLSRRKGIHVSFDVPLGSTTRSLLFELVPVAGKGTPIFPPARTVVVAPPGWLYGKNRTLVQGFSDDLPEYCVRVAMTDLRDGATTESAPVCVKSGAPQHDYADQWFKSVQSCTSPPAPPLTSIWCQAHANAVECGGTGTGGTGTAGSAGSANGGNAGSAGSTNGGNAGSGGQSGRANRAHDGGSCKLARPGLPGTGTSTSLLVLVGLVAAGRRRARRGS